MEVPLRKKTKGKFWPKVRERIWEKAQELFQHESQTTMGKDSQGIQAEKAELREGGFFYRAKLIVLRQINLEKRGETEFDELADSLLKKQKETLKADSDE